jgi:hypothetical protein
MILQQLRKVTTCHPERSEGSAFCQPDEEQILRFAQDDSWHQQYGGLRPV